MFYSSGEGIPILRSHFQDTEWGILMSNINPDLERVLLTQEEISLRVAELAKQISDDYREQGDLYLVGILKGAFIFLADLVRELTIPHTVDFMALSSYGNSTTSSGAVRRLRTVIFCSSRISSIPAKRFPIYTRPYKAGDRGR
jgi:hypothetical protein